MKRKRSAAPVTAAAEQPMPPETVKAPGLSPLDVMKVVVFSLLLFVSMTVQTGRMSLILAVLALLSFIGKEPFRLMGQRLCLPVLGLLGFMVMTACAAVYSHFGSYAVSEFYKYTAAFSLAMILLARFEKKHVPGLLWGFAAVSAAISLLCIDAASASWLFDGFTRFIEALGGSYAEVEQDIWGTRVAGIYNDANVSASILALGSLVSLYLADSGKTLWKKDLACVLLGISAMGFFLSVSRGAILCFALALLVWLIAAGKGNRLSLFFLMFFSALVVVALSIPAMAAVRGGSLLPDALTLLSGLLIFALDWALGARLARALEGRGKAIAVVAAVLAVLCVCYAVAGMTVTGAYTFNESGYLSRTLSLEPGTYTLSGDWDGALRVNVLAQSEMDMLRRTGGGTDLYAGPAEEASFTITGDEFRVSLLIWGEDGQTVRELTFSDGTKVALGHPLLPSFVANRLQDDLLTSNSFLQRVQFFRDGWTLFLRSPLVGHGLGSTEGLLTSVQSYYYESKYVHSHVLQLMDDMGLVGLAAFLALLGGALWLLLKNLRCENGPLAGMLLAGWVVMNIHSLMEINFSVRAYLCAALVFLLLPVVLYGEPLKLKAAQTVSVGLAVLLWLTLAVSGGLLESHRMVLREMETFSTHSVAEYMEACRKFITRDPLDPEQNQLTFVGNAVLLDDSRYNGLMRKYEEELRASGTYTACSGLARYYYLPKGQWEELFACSREGIAQEASNKDAWNLQLNFYRNEVLPAIGAENVSVFLDGVLETKAYLETYSQGRLEEIELTEENAAFLTTVASVRENGLPDEAAYLMLTQMYAPAETPEG